MLWVWALERGLRSHHTAAATAHLAADTILQAHPAADTGLPHLRAVATPTAACLRPAAAATATAACLLPAAAAVTATAACPLPAAVAAAPTGRLLLPAADTIRLAALPAAGSKE